MSPRDRLPKTNGREARFASSPAAHGEGEPETVEVIRIVTETITEEVEVTRIVEGEVVTEQVDVTRIVEVTPEAMEEEAVEATAAGVTVDSPVPVVVELPAEPARELPAGRHEVAAEV